MSDTNYLILNNSSIDTDEFYEISLISSDLIKKSEDYPTFKIPKKVNKEILNIISQHHINEIKSKEQDYHIILEKLKERSYFEFFFVKKEENIGLNENVNVEKEPDVTIEILEILENDFKVHISPHSSLYKGKNRKEYPTITCDFDLLKNVTAGADIGDLLLNYSAQLIANVLNEEKINPNVYSKNDIPDIVIENEDESYLNNIVLFGNADEAYHKLNLI
jgi:hypothetical protein